MGAAALTATRALRRSDGGERVAELRCPTSCALQLNALSCATLDRCLAIAARQPAANNANNASGVHGAAGGRLGWAGTNAQHLVGEWVAVPRAVSCAGDGCLVVGDRQSGRIEPLALRYRF